MEKKSSFTFYVAGPLKYESTRTYLDKIEEVLLRNGFSTWSPYKDAGILSNEDLKNPEKIKTVLEKDIAAFKDCNGAIFFLDGYHVGTIFELGYAYYLTKNAKKDFILIGLYTTIRGVENLDSMIKFCFEDTGSIVTSLSELEDLLLRINKS